MKLSALPDPSALSPLRIGAFATALSLHLLAFALLVLPPRAPELRAVPLRPETLLVDFVARVVARTEPVPPPPQPPRRPPPPRAVTPPNLAPVPVPDVPAAWTVPIDPTPSAPDTAPSPDSGPLENASGVVQIAYLDAPSPSYPPRAIQRGWEGTVLLRVQVDAQGRPSEVLIERSSGHAPLDRHAREHVLRRWRFQPAVRDGRPALAWALVPIGFRLDRG